MQDQLGERVDPPVPGKKATGSNRERQRGEGKKQQRPGAVTQSLEKITQRGVSQKLRGLVI